MTYVVMEYNNTTDAESTYSDNTHPLFYLESEAIRYVKKNNIYGKIEVYDDTAYSEWINDEHGEAEAPYPMEYIEEW